MANPQKENGYTAIANELLEAICRYEFPAKTGLPISIIFHVIRKTYGYHKKEDIISLSQFQLATGEKNRSNLVYWLNYVVQAKILVKTPLSKMQIKYGLNKNYDEWLPLVQVRKLVQVRCWGSASNCTETSASKHTHKRKKENTKEISIKNKKQMHTYTPIDESGNPIKMKSNTKINQTENRELIEVGMLWQSLCSKSLQIPKEEVIMQKIYFPIRSTYNREKFTKEQFKELFEYFFSDRDIKLESKLSFDLCLSQKYVAKWKMKNKHKVITNVSMSNEIKL